MICKLLNCTSGFTSCFTENNRSRIRIGLYFILFFIALLYSASILNGVHLLIKCAVGAGMLQMIENRKAFNSARIRQDAFLLYDEANIAKKQLACFERLSAK